MKGEVQWPFFSLEERCFLFLADGRDTASVVFSGELHADSGRLCQGYSLFQARQHPEVVRQHLPTDRQFPMFKSFGPQGTA